MPTTICYAQQHNIVDVIGRKMVQTVSLCEAFEPNFRAGLAFNGQNIVDTVTIVTGKCLAANFGSKKSDYFVLNIIMSLSATYC